MPIKSKYDKHIPEIRKLRGRGVGWRQIPHRLGLPDKEWPSIYQRMQREDKKYLERFCGGKGEKSIVDAFPIYKEEREETLQIKEKQKFKRGDVVRVNEEYASKILTGKPSYAGEKGVVYGSSADQSGSDINLYSLVFVDDGKVSWFLADDITLIEANRVDLLNELEDKHYNEQFLEREGVLRNERNKT